MVQEPSLVKASTRSWINLVLLALLGLGLGWLYLEAKKALPAHPPIELREMGVGGATFPPTKALPPLHVWLLYLSLGWVAGLGVLELVPLLLPAGRRPRAWVLGACQVLFTVGCLVHAEVTLRIALWNLQTRTYMAPHAIRYWTFNPATDDPRFCINSHGLRGLEMFPEKQPGEFRVLCLGNSVSAGNNLSEVNTYPFLLRAHLQERCPESLVRVQNGAVYGYSIVQGALVLDEIADLYKPDLVIVGFAYFDLALVDDEDQPLVSHRWPMSAFRSLAFKSMLYMTVRQTLLTWQARAHRGQPAEPSLAVDQDRQNRINTRYFRWFVEQARKRGFQLVLYQQYNHDERSHMVPLPPGFRPEIEAMYREMHPQPGQAPPPPHLLRAEQERLGLRIEELAWLEDVPSVELSRTWRMIPDITKYMQDSSHPNVRGTRMQARDIADFLLDRGLVPGAVPAPAR